MGTPVCTHSWTWIVSRPSWRSPAISGVNLAGVEIILNMRQKIDRMQHEVSEFMAYVKREMARGLGDWEERLGTALVKSPPTSLVRAAPPVTAGPSAGRSKRKRKRS